MSKVITYSRTFPTYHPKAWQPTYFVEKFYNSFSVDALGARFFEDKEEELWDLNRHLPYDVYMDFRDGLVRGRTEKFAPKHHTIRSGSRWKVGDKFSPRVWSGRPYNSKQIILAPDIEIKRLWDFEISNADILLDGRIILDRTDIDYHTALGAIAENDGLTTEDLMEWFRYPQQFKGQIICWSDTVNYPA